MTSLMALLSLGLSVGSSTPVQAGTLPRPSLWAEPDYLVPWGSSVTLRCQGTLEAQEFYLNKTRISSPWDMQFSMEHGDTAKFSVPYITEAHAGTYSCSYKSHADFSGYSNPLELVVTGLYSKPSLSVLPSPVVASGGNVTLQCGSHHGFNTFVLTQEGHPETSWIYSQFPSGQYKALFHVGPMKPGRRWSFQCYSFFSHIPQLWSHPSDPLQLLVSASQPRDYTMENLIRLGMAGFILLVLGILLLEAWTTETEVTHHENNYRPCGEDTAGPALHVCPVGNESLQGTTGIRGYAMTPLMALFCLGLSVGTGLLGQAGTLPRPTLWTEPGSVVPWQSSVTLWCRGTLGTKEFHLIKEESSEIWDKQLPLEPGDKAKFSVPLMTATYAGTYRCYYLSLVGSSDHSDPLELVVTGNYIKPSLSALPSPVVASGETVTLQCGSEQEFDSFILTQEGDPETPQSFNSYNLSIGQRQALFSVGPVLPGRRWSFQCYGHYSNTPQLWSHPSDTLQLLVSGSQGSLNLLICVTVISVVLLTLLLFLILYRQPTCS
ncbi:leukocyte immunoglobulin-like receptor subfamily A member 6 [Suncus etruscus]|uniref:leukocyte immunoglobulin-like receptor subfamily A member 6 n=1 Tax=Suncus etruscus TaxID=109475 RepID=UPI0021103C87|nr:leukocyte immunoglobulin-like receptor subfamily A member 6 [Suncus etruscus]